MTDYEGVLDAINPATLESLGSVPVTPIDKIQGLVERARVAASSLNSPENDHRILSALYAHIVRNVDDIAKRISLSTGRPIAETYNVDILPVAQMVAHTLRTVANAPREMSAGLFAEGGRRNIYLTAKPRGAVVLITPWASSFATSLSNIIKIVASGCSVIVKTSPEVPLVGSLIEEICRAALAESGGNPDRIRVVYGGAAHARALIDQRPDKVVFIGSTAAGREVGARCASLIIPHTLELGAKNTAIVLDDADVAHAARGIVWGAFFNSGQSCAAISTVLVPPHLSSSLTEAIVSTAKQLRLGDPLAYTTDLGPLTTANHFHRLQDTIRTLREHTDARLVCGGPGAEQTGHFLRPTVFETSNLNLFDEEFLGPILGMSSYTNREQALASVNNARHGLQASVWTRNPADAHSFVSRLRVGSVSVNDSAFSYALAHLPWGGLRESGYGVTHADDMLSEYRHPFFISTTAYDGRGSAWWFPYQRETALMARNAICAKMDI